MWSHHLYLLKPIFLWHAINLRVCICEISTVSMWLHMLSFFCFPVFFNVVVVHFYVPIDVSLNFHGQVTGAQMWMRVITLLNRKWKSSNVLTSQRLRNPVLWWMEMNSNLLLMVKAKASLARYSLQLNSFTHLFIEFCCYLHDNFLFEHSFLEEDSGCFLFKKEVNEEAGVWAACSMVQQWFKICSRRECKKFSASFYRKGYKEISNSWFLWIWVGASLDTTI